MTEPDFSELVNCKDEEWVRATCARMYELGATVVEATPRPQVGRNAVVIRGWKASPYAR